MPLPASTKYWQKFDNGTLGLLLIFCPEPLLTILSQATTTCRSPKVCSYISPIFESQANITPATVQKIVSEILPPSAGVAFAKEARDLLIECCVEFITLISSEANEISEKEAKKTIACDHITKALEQLGFTDMVPAVLEAAAEHKEVQKVCSSLMTIHVRPSLTLSRVVRRRQISLPRAACPWKSLLDYRRSNLLPHENATTKNVDANGSY